MQACKDWLSNKKLTEQAQHDLSYIRRSATNTPRSYSDFEWCENILKSYLNKYTKQNNVILKDVLRSSLICLKSFGIKQALNELQINNSYTEEGYNLTGLKLVKTTRN